MLPFGEPRADLLIVQLVDAPAVAIVGAPAVEEVALGGRRVPVTASAASRALGPACAGAATGAAVLQGARALLCAQ